MSASDFCMIKNLCTKPTSESHTQICLRNSSLDIIAKEIWPLTAPKLNPLDYNIRGLSQVRVPPRSEDNHRTG